MFNPMMEIMIGIGFHNFIDTPRVGIILFSMQLTAAQVVAVGPGGYRRYRGHVARDIRVHNLVRQAHRC
jgi:hypothetical protein